MVVASASASASAVMAGESEEVTEEAAAPEVSFTKKTVAIYDGDESKKQDIDCLFRDDMPNVPYVDVEQYLELVFNDTDFIMTEDGDQYSVYGKLKDGDKTGSSMVIDVAKDTVNFDQPRAFVVGKENEVDTDFINTDQEKVEKEKKLPFFKPSVLNGLIARKKLMAGIFKVHE